MTVANGDLHMPPVILNTVMCLLRLVAALMLDENTHYNYLHCMSN